VAAISDLSLALILDSVHTSLAVLLDTNYVDVAFGISSISYIETEILRCLISISDSCRNHTVSTLVPLCSLTTKIPVRFWDSCSYLV